MLILGRVENGRGQRKQLAPEYRLHLGTLGKLVGHISHGDAGCFMASQKVLFKSEIRTFINTCSLDKEMRVLGDLHPSSHWLGKGVGQAMVVRKRLVKISMLQSPYRS